MADQDKLMEILKVYNSIHPSRTRWIRSRQALKNGWKELFQALEQASGRDGGKVVLFDENWHTIADKGGVRGPINKEFPTHEVAVDEVEGDLQEEVADTEFTTDDTTEEVQEETTEEVTEPETDANPGDFGGEDAEVVAEPVVETPKPAVKKPAAKKKKKSSKKK